MVGGQFPTFTSVFGAALNAFGIARWNGSTWSAVGGGVSGIVKAMAPLGTQLYVGGTFTAAGSVPAGNLAIWNGSSWAATPAFNGTVETLGVRNGLLAAQRQLYVGGDFTSVGGIPAQHIAVFRVSLNAWSAVGSGLAGTTCKTMFVVDSGLTFFEVLVALDLPNNPQKVWRWNGTTWSPIGAVSDPVTDPVPASLTQVGGQYVLGLAGADESARRFESTGQWTPVRGPGLVGRLFAVDASGPDLVIGGELPTISGVAVNHIARGGPGNWQPLGSGVAGGTGIHAIARTANGDVIAGGDFTSAGGVAANHIARWNGSTWSPLGSGLDGIVEAIRVLANGDIVATGSFTFAGATACNRIARWNGATWQPLGLGLGGPGRALAVLANGDLIVGGAFLTAGGGAANRIARWNGSTWSTLGVGFDDTVQALAQLPNGSLVAGGLFQNSGATSCPFLAIWNGSFWAAPPATGFRPNAAVACLLALPGGDLVAGGRTSIYAPGQPATNLARWNGTQWTALDAKGHDVFALATRPSGTWVAGGDFHLEAFDTSLFTYVVSDKLAQFVACPPTATPYGAQCGGALFPTELPWLGGTYRGLASSLPPQGFAVVVTGFSALALPIATVLPQGAPGCLLLVSPDFLELGIPTAGQLTTQVAIPTTASLVGFPFRQQVAPFATDAVGAVTAIRSTNALLLTIGSY